MDQVAERLQIERMTAALKQIENIADTVLGDYELALNQIGHIADEALAFEQSMRAPVKASEG